MAIIVPPRVGQGRSVLRVKPLAEEGIAGGGDRTKGLEATDDERDWPEMPQWQYATRQTPFLPLGVGEPSE